MGNPVKIINRRNFILVRYEWPSGEGRSAVKPVKIQLKFILCSHFPKLFFGPDLSLWQLILMFDRVTVQPCKAREMPLCGKDAT